MPQNQQSTAAIRALLRDHQGLAKLTIMTCHVQASSQKANPRKGGDDEVLCAPYLCMFLSASVV